MTEIDRIIDSLLENEEDDEIEDFRPPAYLTGIHTDLFKVLEKLGISADQVSTRYSDVYVVCSTWAEAIRVRDAGPWKSMAEIVKTNPDHPDAKQFPWLVDIPFANLGGHFADKLGF